MEKRSKRSWLFPLGFLLLLPLCLSLLAGFASGHERFVLPPDQIARIENIHEHINVFTSLLEPSQLFIFIVFWLFCGLILLLISAVHSNQWAKKVSAFFIGHEKQGIMIVRVVFGFALILASAYQTLFLPDMILTGPWGVALSYVQVCLGFMIIFNFATDVIAFACVLLYLLSIILFGWTALDHIDILGVALYLLFSHYGQTKWFEHAIEVYEWRKKIAKSLSRHSYDMLRIAFGLSLVISGVSKKFLVPEFFMRVVDTFSLSAVFGLEPVFLTLMAGTVEVALGVIIISGIHPRVFAFLAVILFTMMSALMNEGITGHFIIYSILILILTHKPKSHEMLNLERRWERMLNI